MTVGELKAALENIPDNLEVKFDSDSEEAYEIILEKAYRVKYEYPGADYFCIYGNGENYD